MTTADTLRDKYLSEIERDTAEAEKCRARATAARKSGRLKDVTAYEQGEQAWLRHADKHLRILADLMQERA